MPYDPKISCQTILNLSEKLQISIFLVFKNCSEIFKSAVFFLVLSFLFFNVKVFQGRGHQSGFLVATQKLSRDAIATKLARMRLFLTPHGSHVS